MYDEVFSQCVHAAECGSFVATVLLTVRVPVILLGMLYSSTIDQGSRR
jgi:hypothetical protein